MAGTAGAQQPRSTTGFGTDWVQQTLPAGFEAGSGNTDEGDQVQPVSCVGNTTFCVAIVDDSAETTASGTIGFGDVVTTDGSRWNGYADIPGIFVVINSISCASATDCWIAGAGPQDEAEIAQSTDGGQTWTVMTPPDWQTADWWANAIDCPDTTTCWVAGETNTSIYNPAAAVTSNGGTTWTTFSNLPTTPPDSNGDTYSLDGVSCVSDLSCVAVGGLNYADGTATVISTNDGGASWSLSADPSLEGIQQLFSVSCNATSDLPVCTAVGSSLASAGPVQVTSSDGGATWSGTELDQDTGWLSSVSCPSATNCWATGAGTDDSLVGSSDGGADWSIDSVTNTNEYGEVSCASMDFCVADNNGALWVTTDDGGLSSSTSASRFPRTTAGTQRFPRYSAATMNVQAAKPVAVTGQDRLSKPGTIVTVKVQPPSGKASATTTKVGLNDFYSWPISSPALGKTFVNFSIGGSSLRTVTVIAHPDAAPVIQTKSESAAPESGGPVITLRGSNFTGATEVLFGVKPGTALHVLSATELTVVPPSGRGLVEVTVVTSGGGPSAPTGAGRFDYAPPPALNSVGPRSGSTKGGNIVQLNGPGLVWATSVHFGKVLATHPVKKGASEIDVVAPAGAGTVDIIVTAAGGTTKVTAATTYTYKA
jgi:hypothetical protein